MHQTKLARGVLHQQMAPMPFCGEVIRGFGRGSKQLGCPTANIPVAPYAKQLTELPLGVYWGVATVASKVYGMALNVGWSPFYANKEKTIEIHVLAQLDDFYGEPIACVALGYIRPEANFSSVEELKQAIAEDVEYARQQLDTPLAREYMEKNLEWSKAKQV
jgi:FAD synthase